MRSTRTSNSLRHDQSITCNIVPVIPVVGITAHSSLQLLHDVMEAFLLNVRHVVPARRSCCSSHYGLGELRAGGKVTVRAAAHLHDLFSCVVFLWSSALGHRGPP